MCRMDRNSESSREILKYLQQRHAKYGRGTPTAPLPDEWTPKQFQTMAKDIGEKKLQHICDIGEGLLLRGASGMFYYSLDRVFYPMGKTKEEMLEFFTGKKGLKDVKEPLDPYNRREAQHKYDAFIHEWLQSAKQQLQELKQHEHVPL